MHCQTHQSNSKYGIDAYFLWLIMRTMDQQTIIAEIEQRASDRGVAIVLACKRAGVNPSSFYRWRKGQPGALPKIAAVSSAIDDIAKERAA